MWRKPWRWLKRLLGRPEPEVIAPPLEPSPYRTQTVRRGRLGALGMQNAPVELVTRIPKIGDRVWWAPKQLWCEINGVDTETMNFTFFGGEPVRASDGKIVPRWTVMTGMSGHYFDQSINAWVVGHGLLPRNVRGKIITPEPIKMKLNMRTGEVTRTGG